MPISVTCPSCAAGFKVKDVYAGKKARCPKCGEPLTIPTAFQAAETMLESPSVGSNTATPKVKPTGDTADGSRKPNRRRDEVDDPADTSRPKRRSAADEGNSDRPKDRREGEEAGAKPRAKKRVEDDEAEKPGSRKRRDDDASDRPQSKRRRGDDDDRPKKKIALPLVLGILGGVLLLCGGGCTGVYFLVVVPAAERARAANDARQKEIDDALSRGNGGNAGGGGGHVGGGGGENPLLVPGNVYGKVSKWQSLEQVESLIGKGQKADQATVAAVASKTKLSSEVRKVWEDNAEKGVVYRWDNKADQLLLSFAQPEAGGGVEAFLFTFYNKTESRFEPRPFRPVVAIKAEDLASEFGRDAKAAEAKYKPTILKVSGTVIEVSQGGDEVVLKGATGGGRAIQVRVGIWSDDWAAAKGLKAGDSVTAHCSVSIGLALKEGAADRPGVVGLYDGRMAK